MERGTPFVELLPQLSFRERLKAFLDIAQKLENVHNLNLAHLDLKDDNIVMVELSDSSKKYKLIEFDTASELGTQARAGGAWAYMDPKISPDAKAAFSMDIYSQLFFLSTLPNDEHGRKSFWSEDWKK